MFSLWSGWHLHPLMLTSQHKLLVNAVEVAIFLAVQFDAGEVVLTHLQNAARALKLGNATAGLNVQD